jgi:hypothetical protein
MSHQENLNQVIDKNRTLISLGTVLVIIGGVWYGATQSASTTAEIKHLQEGISDLKSIIQANSVLTSSQYTSLEKRIRDLEIAVYSNQRP